MYFVSFLTPLEELFSYESPPTRFRIQNVSTRDLRDLDVSFFVDFTPVDIHGWLQEVRTILISWLPPQRYENMYLVSESVNESQRLVQTSWIRSPTFVRVMKSKSQPVNWFQDGF